MIWVRKEHRDWMKIRSAERRISMTSLFDEMFDFYSKAHSTR